MGHVAQPKPADIASAFSSFPSKGIFSYYFYEVNKAVLWAESVEKCIFFNQYLKGKAIYPNIKTLRKVEKKHEKCYVH